MSIEQYLRNKYRNYKIIPINAVGYELLISESMASKLVRIHLNKKVAPSSLRLDDFIAIVTSEF